MEESLPLPQPVKIGPESILANLTCPAINGTVQLDQESATFFSDQGERTRLGLVSNALIGYSASDQRQQSSSGGLLTEYLCELLEQGIVESVIHVASKLDDNGFEFVKSTTSEEVRNRCKTRYYPVNLSKLQNLLYGEKSVALVANPCFTSNARRLSINDSENFGALKHFVSFFCGHWKSKSWTEYLIAASGVADGLLTDFRFKIAERPANKYGFKVVNGGLEKITPMDQVPISGWQHGIFKPTLCDFCDDVGAESGDVVFGDAWIKPESESSKGTSVVLIRSQIAQNVLNVASQKGTMSLQDLPLSRLQESQDATIRHRQDGLSSRLALRFLQRRSVPPTRSKPRLSLSRATLISFVRYRLARRSHQIWQAVKNEPNAIELFNQRLRLDLFMLRVVNKIPSRRKKE